MKKRTFFWAIAGLCSESIASDPISDNKAVTAEQANVANQYFNSLTKRDRGNFENLFASMKSLRDSKTWKWYVAASSDDRLELLKNAYLKDYDDYPPSDYKDVKYSAKLKTIELIGVNSLEEIDGLVLVFEWGRVVKE